MPRAILVLLALLLAGCAPTPPPTATPTASPEGVRAIDPPLAIKDFALTNQRGEETSLSDLTDKLLVMTFGFTNCPDVCPITLANFTAVKRNLGDAADRVRFVFVSVDGRRDTPEHLGRYLRAFDPEFIGLTGDESVVRVVGNGFGVTFTAEAPIGGDPNKYNVTHTASAFLVDQSGLRRIYSYGTSPEVIAADIRQVLGQ